MTMKPPGKKGMPRGLSRRSVVAMGAIAGAAPLPLSVAAISNGDGSQTEAALLSVFRDSKAVAQLGDAVLGAWPNLSNRFVLLSLILNDLRMEEERLVRADVTSIATCVSQCVRDDFAARRTVMLDGWVLSVTETRLYALAALAGV